jgi:hypothetical protein
MNKLPIAISANSKLVYAYLIQDPLAASIARNPHLLTLVREVVSTLQPTRSEVIIEQDMGHVIGYSDQLETREDDAIFYARTSKLPGYTRFVRQRKAEHTSVLTFKLVEDDEGNYELVNAWIGKTYPPIPDGTDTTSQSKEYWARHAVVFNGQTILASTVTKDCPY